MGAIMVEDEVIKKIKKLKYKTVWNSKGREFYNQTIDDCLELVREKVSEGVDIADLIELEYRDPYGRLTTRAKFSKRAVTDVIEVIIKNA